MTTIPEKDLALYRVDLVMTLETSRYVLATDVRECEHATGGLARTVETNACAI